MPRGVFPRPSLAERFWPKVNRVEEGCWEWRGARAGTGYGAIWVDGRGRPAHRVAYELEVGPIPDGLQLDHLCCNPACVRPDHLEPVTQAENIRRGNGGKHWAEKTHCPQGHPYDEANTFVNGKGRRECRTCRNERNRARRARLKA